MPDSVDTRSNSLPPHSDFKYWDLSSLIYKLCWFSAQSLKTYFAADWQRSDRASRHHIATDQHSHSTLWILFRSSLCRTQVYIVQIEKRWSQAWWVGLQNVLVGMQTYYASALFYCPCWVRVSPASWCIWFYGLWSQNRVQDSSAVQTQTTAIKRLFCIWRLLFIMAIQRWKQTTGNVALLKV